MSSMKLKNSSFSSRTLRANTLCTPDVIYTETPFDNLDESCNFFIEIFAKKYYKRPSLHNIFLTMY